MVQQELAKTALTASTRRQVLQSLNRLLNLAAQPFELIEINPLRTGFLPKVRKSDQKIKDCLLPSEDARLMLCVQVPLVERLLYGVLVREGFRVSELLELTWAAFDLANGSVVLDDNKTDDPRAWALDPGVAEALRIWKELSAKARPASAKVFQHLDGKAIDRYEAAERLRDYLKLAGVTRAQLFERSERRLPLRAHDLRASFVTVSLANGKSETWVTDRTGHRSSAMIRTYDRQVRKHQELELGSFVPLDQAIPEFAAAAKTKA
jgi:integrase